MKKNRPAKTAKITYTYAPEIIRRFRNSSAEWKLNWLEEVNNITNQVLTKKEKEIRNKIRQGAIKPNEHLKEHLKTTPLQRLEWLEQANKFVYEIGKSGKKKALKIGEKHRPAYGRLRGEQSRTPYGK